MRHLIVSREYPPAPYAPGGIGTYAANMARLLAERGETVHVIAERWKGAPLARESFLGGRLVVHRVGARDLPEDADPAEAARLQREITGLRGSSFPNQWFAWSVTFCAERLFEQEGIDVVEAQEWEAPLYYLLLRRTLGLSRGPRPPCIVHLHSASAIIRHYNGPIAPRPAYPAMKRMEEFCIREADALLCPSRYYAAQCAEHFRQPVSRIKVIPLPVGRTARLERGAQAWADGPICFVGRLEPRKGIVEWVAAAARVAAEDPQVAFDFVGADVWELEKRLRAGVPAALRSRFRFHGARSREAIQPFLAAARAAVVPSRWENFPNVCLEAMGSGLPVIATRLGGMVEMVEDGRTGWLTPNTGVAGMVDGLAEALRRCLAATPEERAAMGAAAREAVGRLCDNEAVTEAQIAFRAEVAAAGAGRPAASAASVAAPRATGPTGPAGIVIRAESRAAAERVLASVERQTQAPGAVALVVRAAPGEGVALPGDARLLLHAPHAAGPEAWNLGHAALLGRDLGYWIFLDEQDALEPTCLERVEQVLAHRPDLGIVSPWLLWAGPKALDAPPSPDLVHQLVANDVAPASAFRAEALGEGPPFRPGLPQRYDIWAAANAILAKGWAAATLPEALACRDERRPRIDWPEATALRAIRAELLAPLEAVTSRALLDLVDEHVPLPGAGPEPPRRKRRGHYVSLILRPHRGIRALLRRARILDHSDESGRAAQ